MNDHPSDPVPPRDPAAGTPPEPRYAAPQYATPQYAAPQYAAPQYAAPQYAAPQYATPTSSGYTRLLPGPGEPFDGAQDPRELHRPRYGATFGQAIGRFFQGYARFSGRASLSEYWFSRLFCVLLVGAWGVAAGIVLSLPDSLAEPLAAALFILGALALLGFVLPTLAITWRRLHDANLPGPLWFLALVPLGDLAVLVLLLLPSRPEGRRFDLPHAAPHPSAAHPGPAGR